MTWLSKIGPLRAGLFLLIIVLIIAAPFADGKVYMHDWRLFPSVIAPSVVMMVLFVLPLDVTMSCVFMADAEPEQRSRLKQVVIIDIVMFLMLIAAWSPFMLKVLDINPLN